MSGQRKPGSQRNAPGTITQGKGQPQSNAADQQTRLLEKEKEQRNAWINRVAKELKSQREYSHKWKALNDPKLYMGETAPPEYPQKSSPTKWSVYSVINPPGQQPLPERPKTPPGYIAPTYKITGDRINYLSYSKPVSTQQQQYKHQKGSQVQYAQQKQGQYTEQPRTLPRETHPLPSSQYHRTPPAPPPAFHSAPFATATPVSHAAVTSLQKHQRGSLAMYNANLVGARAGNRAQFAQDPITAYRFPATHTMEYGWAWNGRKSLEIYGSTSADFVRESWKHRVS